MWRKLVLGLKLGESLPSAPKITGRKIVFGNYLESCNALHARIIVPNFLCFMTSSCNLVWSCIKKLHDMKNDLGNVLLVV